MPRIDEVEDLDGGAGYPIITGDYSGVPAWERTPIVAGTPVGKPTPVFTKLDPSVVDEELERLSDSIASPRTRPRSDLVWPRCFFASSRRSLRAAGGLRRHAAVGAAGASASRSWSARRSRAATRLRCCERCSEATIAHRRRAAGEHAGPAGRRSSAVEAATSYSSSTRLSVVLTDWPPGPDERLNRSTSSASRDHQPVGEPGPGADAQVVAGLIAGAAPLDRRAGVHHHRHAGRAGPLERGLVDHAELEPHAPAPTATAWSANSPAASERRKTSTTSIGNGTSARVA